MKCDDIANNTNNRVTYLSRLNKTDLDAPYFERFLPVSMMSLTELLCISIGSQFIQKYTVSPHSKSNPNFRWEFCRYCKDIFNRLSPLYVKWDVKIRNAVKRVSRPNNTDLSLRISKCCWQCVWCHSPNYCLFSAHPVKSSYFTQSNVIPMENIFIFTNVLNENSGTVRVSYLAFSIEWIDYDADSPCKISLL